jgi:hypothetical protein
MIYIERVKERNNDMKDFEKFKVPVDKLRRVCSREEFDFCKTTVDVSPLDGFIVQ